MPVFCKTQIISFFVNFKSIKTMKSLFLFISLSCTLLCIVSCEKNESAVQKPSSTIAKTELYHSVTEGEYKKASQFTKRLIDQVDAAVNSLDIISKNKNVLPYEAIININKNSNNKLSNFVTIAPLDESGDSESNARVAAPDGKCHFCGLKSAYSCIAEVEEYMDKNHKDEIDVHVKRTSDGCVDITYK